MTTNNLGNTLDSSGAVAVDFVWGNVPMQPNDDRNSSDWATPVTTTVSAANAAQNNGWSGYSTFPAVHLNPSLDSHAIVEAKYAAYPAFSASPAVAIVTAVSANGTTITYTSQNTFVAGQSVTITGLTTSAFNLSAATVAFADATKFTITSATTGVAVTGNYGRAEDASAPTDGAYISGVAYINVPTVLGQVTATAVDTLRDSGYELASITTASGATNTAKSITQINVTTSAVATVTASGAGAAYPVGTKVAIGAGTGIPTALVGSWTVTGTATNTITISGSGWTVADTGAITPAASLTGLTGTIKTQSVAAGAASVLTTATITITPWA